MYRATTPTHTFTLPINTSDCLEIQVTYKQGGVVLVKHYQDNVLPSGMALDGKDVIISLTQEETLMFSENSKAKVQVRVLTQTNDVMASQKFPVKIQGVLNGEILQ